MTLCCALQVHQSAQALRWMMQALRGNGFSPGEDVPPVGKQSLTRPQQHHGPAPGLSSPSHPSVKQGGRGSLGPGRFGVSMRSSSLS